MSDRIIDATDQLIEFFFILTENLFKTKYSEDEALEKVLLFKEKFFELISKYEDDKIIKNDAINPIFLIALHDSQQITKDELLNQMLSIYRELLSEILFSQRLDLELSNNPWEDFVNSTKSVNKAMYENEYFKCKTIVDTDQQFGFDINRCIYYEIFKENDYEFLAPLLCEYDFILSDNIKDWVTFNRDETIAKGYKRCTFRYKKNFP